MTQTAIQQAIHRLFVGENLTSAQADAAMTEIMQGEATAAQIGAFLGRVAHEG